MPSSSIYVSQSTMWKRMQGKVGGAKQADYSIRPQDPNSTISPLDLYPPQQWDSRGTFAASQKPQRDQREQSEQSLPDIPYETAEIGTAQQGHRRQASSVYSQYPITPGVPQHQDQGHQQPRFQPQNQASANFHDRVRTYEETVEISPPSSPDLPQVKTNRMQHTGPTTSMSFMPSSPPLRQLPVTQKKDSSIPVMRREKRQQEIGRKQVGGVRAVSSSTASSYDPYGQRPANRGLQESQWETVNTLQSFNEDDHQATQYKGHEPTVTNLEGMYGAPYVKQPTQTFGDKFRKIREGAGGKRAPSMPLNQRPEWKGGSGRMAIVPAPEDNPYVPPLMIPRKSSKRVPSLPSINSSRNHTPVAGTPVREASPLSVMTANPQGYFKQNQPPPRTSSVPTPVSAPSAKYDDSYEDRFADHMPASPLDSLPSQKNRSVSNLVPGGSIQHNLPQSVSTIERNFDSALAGVKVGSSSPSHGLDQHPAHRKHHPTEVSRFSVTTYAPSTTAGSARTSTDSAPPMPDITQSGYHKGLYSQDNPSENSILNRKRPVQPSTHTFDATTADLERPTLPRDTTLKVLAIREHKPSVSKALPKSPMELSQSDKCLALQAQLDDLSLQKGNIERSIKAMTALIPSEMTGLPPGLDAEGRKREMERRDREKKKVEGLREELARVKSAEHEVGIKMHRALRKRDESGGYEPSGLWVRRVTG